MGNSRKALITGSSRGIGAAIAKRLALDGVEIVVVHGNQNPTAAETVVKEITDRGGKATFVLGDLSKPDSIKAMLNSLEDRAQELNILINNAGIFLGASLDSLILDDIHRVLSVNVISLILITPGIPSAEEIRGRTNYQYQFVCRAGSRHECLFVCRFKSGSRRTHPLLEPGAWLLRNYRKFRGTGICGNRHERTRHWRPCSDRSRDIAKTGGITR